LSNQTLALLLVAFVGALTACTVLALHGLVPASVAASIAAQGLTGAFAFAQSSGAVKSVASLVPELAPVLSKVIP
jgi:hypothetical protein